jgi:hypothetical protein
MSDTKQPEDKLGEFLRQYTEYLEGHRPYSNLPTIGAARPSPDATPGGKK